MKLTGLILLLMMISPAYAAVTVVECEDTEGERTFQKTCPPGTTQVDQRRVLTGTASSESTSSDEATITATLYMVPECVVCGDVQEFLESRDIVVTVKDASTEQAVQEELKAINGELRVPVVVIGETVITGYKRDEMTSALMAAGYNPNN